MSVTSGRCINTRSAMVCRVNSFARSEIGTHFHCRTRGPTPRRPALYFTCVRACACARAGTIGTCNSCLKASRYFGIMVLLWRRCASRAKRACVCVSYVRDTNSEDAWFFFHVASSWTCLIRPCRFPTAPNHRRLSR